MLKSEKVMTFIAVADRDRARIFYSETLGLQFIVDDNYSLVFDLNGIMLRISTLPAVTPHPYTTLGWQVSDIAAQTRDLAGRGVIFERFPGLDHTDDGTVTFPNGDKVVWFKDPDGNILSLMQFSAVIV